MKIKHNQSRGKENNNDIPKIHIIDIDENKKNRIENGVFQMDYDALIQQATEAQTYLEQLFDNNCK